MKKCLLLLASLSVFVLFSCGASNGTVTNSSSSGSDASQSIHNYDLEALQAVLKKQPDFPQLTTNGSTTKEITLNNQKVKATFSNTITYDVQKNNTTTTGDQTQWTEDSNVQTITVTLKRKLEGQKDSVWIYRYNHESKTAKLVKSQVS